VNYGEVLSDKNRNLPDLSPREWALMIPTVALCIFMGVAPGVFLKPMEPSVVRTLDRFNGVPVSSAGSRSEERIAMREQPGPVADRLPQLAPPTSAEATVGERASRLEVRR